MESSVITSVTNVLLFDNCDEIIAMSSFVTLVVDKVIHVTVFISNSCGNRN